MVGTVEFTVAKAHRVHASLRKVLRMPPSLSFTVSHVISTYISATQMSSRLTLPQRILIFWLIVILANVSSTSNFLDFPGVNFSLISVRAVILAVVLSEYGSYESPSG